jgi:hypothetical protein
MSANACEAVPNDRPVFRLREVFFSASFSLVANLGTGHMWCFFPRPRATYNYILRSTTIVHIMESLGLKNNEYELRRALFVCTATDPPAQHAALRHAWGANILRLARRSEPPPRRALHGRARCEQRAARSTRRPCDDAAARRQASASAIPSAFLRSQPARSATRTNRRARNSQRCSGHQGWSRERTTTLCR